MTATLDKKLQIKPKQSLLVINAPTGYLDGLQEVLQDIRVSDQHKLPPDSVLLFVNNLAQVDELLPDALRIAGENDLFWIAYPKGSSGVKTDINRDILWEVIIPYGWRPVRQVALDDTWSALRFRPSDRGGK